MTSENREALKGWAEFLAKPNFPKVEVEKILYEIYWTYPTGLPEDKKNEITFPGTECLEMTEFVIYDSE